MDFTIRQAAIEDLSTIQTLNHEVFRSDRAYDEVLDLDWPFSPKGVHYYRSSLTDPHKIVFLAQDNEGNVLGYVIGTSHEKWGWRKKRTGELENMFVAESARRIGIGRALVNALADRLRAMGVDRMYVSAYGKNEGAVHFYDACGFDLWSVGLEMKL